MIFFPKSDGKINAVIIWILGVLITIASTKLLLSGLNWLFSPTADEIAERVILGINAERQELGLEPLIVNEHLMLIARWRSEDMATGGYFSHDPPDGHPTRDDLLARLGYGRQHRPPENIAAVRPLISQNAVPYLIIDCWRDSPGHWVWAMSPEQTLTGVGVAIADDGTVIATQLFWDESNTPLTAYKYNRESP
jgi:uncharacterized protein YkwD